MLLYHTKSKESRLAKELLKENQREFTEVYTEDYDSPKLLTQESIYSYKGLNQIKQYISSQK